MKKLLLYVLLFISGFGCEEKFNEDMCYRCRIFTTIIYSNNEFGKDTTFRSRAVEKCKVTYQELMQYISDSTLIKRDSAFINNTFLYVNN
jgi:hypothetical protein